MKPELLSEAIQDADQHIRDVVKTRIESPGTLLAELWARFIRTFFGKETLDKIFKKGK
jgi:hypothetical protein